MAAKKPQIMRIATCLAAVCILSVPAYARYSGGTGEPNDPYQIATAEDLMLLGETPNDYGKHFILTADIDLDPNLPDRKVFDRAVIGYFGGVFDGNGHTISHLTIAGTGCLGLFGTLGEGKTPAEVRNLGVVDVNITGGDCVGGLAGTSYRDSVVSQCYTTGSVRGKGYIGGLMGNSRSDVSQCYSTAAVSGDRSGHGTDGGIGGLVGESLGVLTDCYSIGLVTCYSPDRWYRVKSTAGGLVGRNGQFAFAGVVTNCFWDTETSGQSASNGGMGLTTGEMQSVGTFLAWGTCGNAGEWTIDDGRDYPRLSWQKMPGAPIALGATLSDFLTGAGTQDDPYLIYTPDELNLVGLFTCDWDKHYKLMADIDMSGFDGKDGRPRFNMIAPGRLHGFEELFFQGIPFTGLFDGNDHTISHLIVKTIECGGMFGGLGTTGRIRNLRVADVNIVGSAGVGGLVGFNDRDSSVTRCYSAGVVSGGPFVGGLVGYNNRGTVDHCYSAGALAGSGSVGGLVGHNRGGTVVQCHSDGAVTSTFWAAGGLVGYNEWGTSVNQCYSTGSANGELFVGGLVGVNTWGSSVTECYSTGPASGESGVGGLIGSNGDANVMNCYSTGTVSGSGRYVGGLAGENWFGSISQCYSTGLVTGVREVGGLLGMNYGTPSGPVTGCFWDSETSGQLTSTGGTGKTTAEMKTAKTFLDAGWDFVGETANGTQDIWRIDEGKDYPRLMWQGRSN